MKNLIMPITFRGLEGVYRTWKSGDNQTTSLPKFVSAGRGHTAKVTLVRYRKETARFKSSMTTWIDVVCREKCKHEYSDAASTSRCTNDHSGTKPILGGTEFLRFLECFVHRLGDEPSRIASMMEMC